jgi:hypothetical protein
MLAFKPVQTLQIKVKLTMTLSRFTSPAQENPDLCTWILPHSKSELWTRKPLSAILLFGRTATAMEPLRTWVCESVSVSWHCHSYHSMILTPVYKVMKILCPLVEASKVHPSSWQHFTKLHMAGSCQRWIRSILVTHVPQLGWPQMSTDLVFLQSKHGPRCPVCNIVPVHIYEVSEKTPHNSLKITFVSVPAIAQ